MNQLLENIYREHRQGLYSFALSVTGSEQLAEDAIQIAFTNLYRNQSFLSNVSVDDGAVAYVFKTVRNSAIDLKRSDQRQKRLSDSLFLEYRCEISPETPPEQLLTKERDELLRTAVNRLPETDREAIVLKLFAGLTFEQAGKAINASPKTVATRYRRALGKLENHLKGQL